MPSVCEVLQELQAIKVKLESGELEATPEQREEIYLAVRALWAFETRKAVIRETPRRVKGRVVQRP